METNQLADLLTELRSDSGPKCLSYTRLCSEPVSGWSRWRVQIGAVDDSKSTALIVAVVALLLSSDHQQDAVHRTRPSSRYAPVSKSSDDVHARTTRRLQHPSARSSDRIPSKRVAGSAHRRNKSFSVDFTTDPDVRLPRPTVAAFPPARRLESCCSAGWPRLIPTHLGRVLITTRTVG